MKTTLPKEVTALTSEIQAKLHLIEKHRADIARANDAAAESERLNVEIETLSRKRAEHKAMAFVAGRPADVAELDRKQEQLETASRVAREDGGAAAVAITMLQEKIVVAEAEAAGLEEQRKKKVIEWLATQREKAVDQYLAALDSLGAPVAEALAAEAARRRLVPDPRYREDVFTRAGEAVRGLPMPRGAWEERPSNNSRWIPAVPDWSTDPDHGKSEREAVLAALAEAGVL